MPQSFVFTKSCLCYDTQNRIVHEQTVVIIHNFCLLWPFTGVLHQGSRVFSFFSVFLVLRTMTVSPLHLISASVFISFTGRHRLKEIDLVFKQINWPQTIFCLQCAEFSHCSTVSQSIQGVTVRI